VVAFGVATNWSCRPIRTRGPPDGIASWEDLAKLTPEEIKKRDLFPYKPLAHPLQTTAHMLFPDNWVRAHPEHERMDVGFDIPDAYLPEFPPRCF